MCCQKFKEQSESDNREMLSKISHMLREDDKYFVLFEKLIEEAKVEGVFNKVKIGNLEVFNSNTV